MNFYRLTGAIFYDCITICQFIKPSLAKKISIFKEYGALKVKAFYYPKKI